MRLLTETCTLSKKTVGSSVETTLAKVRDVQIIVQQLTDMDEHLRSFRKGQQDAIKATIIVWNCTDPVIASDDLKHGVCQHESVAKGHDLSIKVPELWIHSNR